MTQRYYNTINKYIACKYLSGEWQEAPTPHETAYGNISNHAFNWLIKNGWFVLNPETRRISLGKTREAFKAILEAKKDSALALGLSFSKLTWAYVIEVLAENPRFKAYEPKGLDEILQYIRDYEAKNDPLTDDEVRQTLQIIKTIS